MRPIILTSLTAIIGAIMIANDPVWWGLAYVLIFWLAASATLMLLIVPLFIYDIYDGKVLEEVE
jgi:multidrug efflux pump subunit AcrB